MSFIVAFIVALVVYLLVELFRPKPKLEDAKPSGLGDWQFPTATEGRSVPLLWGTCRIKGPNVVWYGDLKLTAITERVKTGLFSSDRVTLGFHYFVGIQFALCRGDGITLSRIGVGEKEAWTGTVTHGDTAVINKPFLFGGDRYGNGGIWGTLEFFDGNNTQAKSTYLSAFQLEDTKTPAYRTICYLAPLASPLYVGNSPSVEPWEFDVERIPNGLGLTGGNDVVNGADCNPMNVVYEIMTNDDWGLKFDSSTINISNFTTVASTLKTEGNGFSFLLDRPIDAVDVIRMIEEQIDGVFFMNQQTGKWECNLARADYDIDTIPELTSANIIEISSFARGSWAETTNQVRVGLHHRDDDYKKTFALAQDSANQRVQGGVNISVTREHPGVKVPALANQLAWRELRTLSFPLAKASIVVDRTFYDVQPADVLAFTDVDLNFTKLPLRVISMDFGELTDGRITLELIQDVFFFQVGKFGDPFDSGWDPPSDTLTAFTEQVAFEAPRGLVTRDPDGNGVSERVWASGVRVGNEVGFKIVERHAIGAPAGAFTEIGAAFGFMLLGTLTGSLASGTAIPTSTIEIAPSGGATQSEIESEFEDDPDLTDQGLNLLNLVVVDNEFMLVASATNSGGSNVNLNNVRRGVLDSVQAAHSSGAKVYLIFVGGGLSEDSVATPNNIDVKLLPTSVTDELDPSAATQIQFTMSNRYRRPYPPSSITLDSTLFASSTSMEANGTDGEDYAIDLLLNRRDFRTGDEVQALTTDAADIFTDYPTVNSTDHQVDVRNDPAGPNTLLFTDTFTTKQHDVRRWDILKETDGVLPTTIRFVTRSRHTEQATALSSRYDLTHDFTVTTALTGQFNFAALDTNDVSNTYTATVAGTYNFTLTSSFTVGDVQYSLNGGGWTQLIAAGTTTGNIAGVSVSDTIRVRHLSSDSGAEKQLDMSAAGAGQDGYAILFV